MNIYCYDGEWTNEGRKKKKKSNEKKISYYIFLFYSRYHYYQNINKDWIVILP